MFEEKTYEALLQEKLNMVSNQLDRQEGSVIYDALAPNSAEQAQMYITLEWMFRQMFGDTASREYLLKIAKDTRGLAPKPATYAVLKAVFNTEVKIGSRFNLNELNYIVTECLDEREHSYKLRCETIGAAGNRQLGELIPIEYINGLTDAELTELLIPGEEEEETEVFRKRWRAAFNGMAFGGNKTDYMEKVNGISGVGGCKCYRCTNEAGEVEGAHVRCVIIAADHSVPSTELIHEVQQILDPLRNQEGDGLAPIGHIAHVVPAAGRKVNIDTTITYDTGYSFEDLKSYVEKAIDGYFAELASQWQETNGLVVRISRLESDLLKINGIVDIGGTRLNGNEANIMLGGDEIPVRGVING